MSVPQGVGEIREAEIQELAEYFDQTDAGELPWEEASDAAIARPELEQVSLRLPKDDLAELRRRARRAGVGYTTLIRMILRQHLQNPLTR
jgi:predicted DNA binding CopG/RHH family protein